jgi:RimJ/RimL family protein N-acetyltransferase
MYSIYSDAETMTYWSDPPVSTLEQAARMVNADLHLQMDGNAAFWAIVLPDTGRVIGKFTLINFSQSNRRAEIGYILNRQFWRKGYMTEVLTEMISLAFFDFGLHRLEADIEPDNVGSAKLLEKLGFQREGYLRQRWHVYDQWQDSVLLGLIRPDWQRLLSG